jgi:hypothetical protein
MLSFVLRTADCGNPFGRWLFVLSIETRVFILFVPHEDVTYRRLKHLESYKFCCCFCVVMKEMYYEIRVLKLSPV